MKIIAFTYLFWVCYMVYASYHTAVKAGKEIHWFTKVLMVPILVVGIVLDILWNATIGSLLYLEVPWVETWKFWTKEWTFTHRCNRHFRSFTWRGDQARFWAKVLNPFDDGHIS